MPPFPERESSILAKLKKKKGPGNLPDIDDIRRNVNGSTEHNENTEEAKKVAKFDSLQIIQSQILPASLCIYSFFIFIPDSAKLPPLICSIPIMPLERAVVEFTLQQTTLKSMAL